MPYLYAQLSLTALGKTMRMIKISLFIQYVTYFEVLRILKARKLRYWARAVYINH